MNVFKKEKTALPTVFRKKLPDHLEKIRQGHYVDGDENYPLWVYYKENDISVQEEGSEIVSFLKGKHVLVSGATGFLGKLLIEKLLRCCKDIGSIYIIVRSKKGKDAEERINEYLSDLVFYRTLEKNPDCRKKVIGLEGDLEKDGLGLSETSKKLIKDKVNIIYHMAATVRFDEKLKKAVIINIRGTQQLIALAKSCKKLDVFAHMSSAFTNCHFKCIEEKFYPPHIDPYKLMDLIDSLPDDVIERITPGLLGTVPNTYVFTKQIAEDLVRREAADLPAYIHRPSIVISSVSEPVRSWVDNIYGPVGLILGAVLGLMHIAHVNPNLHSDMVPVDYAVNNYIAASANAAKERKESNLKIYNYTTASENYVYWKDLYLSVRPVRKLGTVNAVMHGFCGLTGCYYWYWFVQYLLHIIPAYIVDIVLILKGQKPLLRDAYTKINKFMTLLSYFTLQEWRFDNNNVNLVWDKMNDVDKKNFPSDMRSLSWKDYFVTYQLSVREFLLNEPLDNLEEGRHRLKMLQIFFFSVVLVVLGSSVYFLLNTKLFFVPVALLSILAYYVKLYFQDII